MKRAKISETPIRLGISTCLLGERVRFDGGHKKDRFIAGVLGKYFECVPVCPELEVGMGVPREPVHLVGFVKSPRMLGVISGKDWTARMRSYSAHRVKQLAELNLCGYIFKSDSPSCGIGHIRVHGKSGILSKSGRGLFANAFIRANPWIPVEDETRLNNPVLRENFITRVFVYHRLQLLFRRKLSVGKLVEFHAVHKYLMIAHSPKHYAELDRHVAKAKKSSRDVLRKSYTRLFMEGLKRKSTVKKNVNVLHQIVGFLRDRLSSDEKKGLLESIENYRRELVPLIVPITLTRHQAKIHNVPSLLNQIYLNPHPIELRLRDYM